MHYVVFGSSSGMLTLFGAATFGVATHGHELLPSLVRQARSLAQQPTPLPNLEYTQGDMLNADLSATAVLLLASQCWDEPLLEQVWEKIRTQLPSGAFVVDYRAPPVALTAGDEPALALVATTTVLLSPLSPRTPTRLSSHGGTRPAKRGGRRGGRRGRIRGVGAAGALQE